MNPTLATLFDRADEVVGVLTGPFTLEDTVEPGSVLAFTYPNAGPTDTRSARVLGLFASGRLSTVGAAAGDLTFNLLVDGVVRASLVLSPADGLVEEDFVLSVVLTVQDAAAAGSAAATLVTASGESTLAGMTSPDAFAFDGTVAHSYTLEAVFEVDDPDNILLVTNGLVEARRAATE